MGLCPFIRPSVRTGVPSIYLREGWAGGHMGPPLWANRNISGRAGEDTRPYGVKWSEGVGSAKPGAVSEPQQR